MNKTTEILINDIGIGKYDCIVRAMNLEEEHFLRWAQGKEKIIQESCLKISGIKEYEITNLEFFNLIQSQKETIKNNFSETCSNSLK
tara:strand:+ start:691 stop:951 length:261 start_codon:yes stop_codon:yes gene_type:complete